MVLRKVIRRKVTALKATLHREVHHLTSNRATDKGHRCIKVKGTRNSHLQATTVHQPANLVNPRKATFPAEQNRITRVSALQVRRRNFVRL